LNGALQVFNASFEPLNGPLKVFNGSLQALNGSLQAAAAREVDGELVVGHADLKRASLLGLSR
jgi:hypothetical protein